MKHLLLTNDFPPKVGGIQTYLWELWRRLPPDDVTVMTTRFPGAAEWDASQPYRIERSRHEQLLPTPSLARDVDALADEVGADLVIVDPAFPVGLAARWMRHPYGVILHGAEVTVPGRLPVTRSLLGSVLRGADLVLAAGGYPAAEGERAARRHLDAIVVPPGVDVHRFAPLAEGGRSEARARFGVGPEDPLMVSVSRLVPRKGMDVLIEASSMLRETHPGLEVLIGGEGRDRARLEKLVRRHDAPVRFLGRVADDDLPVLYACADLAVMLCRNRWAGLEQEGFGIVFLEAAACGVAQVAGRSGGSHEAVVDGVTGVVLGHPRRAACAADAIDSLLADPGRRVQMGNNARERAVRDYTYEVLAEHLRRSLAEHGATRS